MATMLSQSPHISFRTRLCRLSYSFRHGLTVALLPVAFAVMPQTPHLEEILLGRCCFRPPTLDGSADGCPSVVGDLVSVLEGHNDEDITASDYSRYFSVANLTTPTDRGLFWLGGGGFGMPLPNLASAEGGLGHFVRVEDTAGGELMKGLTFCGANLNDECSFGEWDAGLDGEEGGWQGAQASFWYGAYAGFAGELRGHVRAVIVDGEGNNQDAPTSYGNQSLFVSAALPKLDPSKVTRFDLFVLPTVTANKPPSVTCETHNVIKLMDKLVEQGIDLIVCTVDPFLLHMLLCADSPDSLPCEFIKDVDETSEVQRHAMGFFSILLFVLLMGAALAIMVKKYRTWQSYDRVPDTSKSVLP